MTHLPTASTPCANKFKFLIENDLQLQNLDRITRR